MRCVAPSRHQHRAVGAAGQRGDLHLAAHHLGGLLELVGAVQAADLDLVGDQDVDVPGDQVGELGAPAVDAERIGQAERDPAAVAVGDLAPPSGRRPWRRAGPTGSPRDRRSRPRRPAPRRRRPAPARRRRRDRSPWSAARRGVTNTRQRAVGGPCRERRRAEVDPGGADVVAEHLAQLVVLDLADVGRCGAERGERRHGVGAGARRTSRSPAPCPRRARSCAPDRSGSWCPWPDRGARACARRSRR